MNWTARPAERCPGMNKAQAKAVFALLAVTCAAVSGARAADDHPVYPSNFLQAATAFRIANPTNRYPEAEALRKALPVTQIVSVTYTGTASNMAGRGSRFEVRDYDHPSFILTRSEVLRLLGTPYFTNSLSYFYPVASGPGYKFPVSLYLHFPNENVVLSGIFSQAPSVATLSSNEQASVVKLANLCGIRNVTDVSTVGHLTGTTVEVSWDEEVEGRTVTFSSLQIHRDGWDRQVRPNTALSVGEFWAEPGKPAREQRALVQVGQQRVRVGLLNGIKPEGADKIMDAFVNGKVGFANDSLKYALWGVDVTRPSWIGISDGKLWITFPSSHTRIVFEWNGDHVTLLEKIESYE